MTLSAGTSPPILFSLGTQLPWTYHWDAILAQQKIIHVKQDYREQINLASVYTLLTLLKNT